MPVMLFLLFFRQLPEEVFRRRQGFVQLLEAHYGVRAERQGENAIALHRNEPVAL